MEGVEKAKPPDPGGTVNNESMPYNDDDSMLIDEVPNDRKRRKSLEEERQTKKRADTSEEASASIAHIYKHPTTELSRNYSPDDKGPFIVHVAREDHTNAGLSLRPIKVGLILVKNKVQNVVKDGVKSLGRNRVSIEFKTASDANKFLSSSSYADTAKQLASPKSQLDSEQEYEPSAPPFSPLTQYSTPSRSYRKTIFNTPRARTPLAEGYDRRALNEIIAQPQSELPNGTALQESQRTVRFTPNEDLFELLFKLLTNIISKWMSQVKHNSFFIVGFVFGLWLALTVVPLGESTEECVAQVVTEGGEDEYAPVREERPLGGGGPARAVQRPRYYTTELGIRAPLLAAVLSSEAALGAEGRAAALNATMGRLQPALRFFIAASTPVAPGLPNVVGFTDTREMLKPFHALKYLADNYLDEYNFFFLVSDGSFVNARRLSELVGRLSVSQDVYMGTVAEDDSHYCTLEGGILLSNSVLRAVHNELDWCVRNSYSAHHHENIGRCVLHASHMPCTPGIQHQIYQSVRDENPAPPSSLPDAVTAYPVTEPKRFHELHAYVYLERDAQQVSSLRAALQHTGRKHPVGYRNASWPRGLRDDPGLAPPKPDNRFDHLRWTSFNATHAFMPDDHRSVGLLTGATAKAVQLVLDAAKAWALKRWAASDADLVEGSWRWEPATALRYRLLMKLQSEEGSVLRYLEVAKPLGSARLVPVAYVTESARVWMVLPANIESAEATLAFINRYEAACLNKRANTALVVVVLRRSGTAAEAGATIRDTVRALASKHRTAIIHTAEVEVTPDVPTGSAGDEIFARSALEAALPTAPRDALLLLATPGMDFNEDFLNRVRLQSMIFARSALEAALPTAPRDALLLLATPGMDFNEDFLNRGFNPWSSLVRLWRRHYRPRRATLCCCSLLREWTSMRTSSTEASIHDLRSFGFGGGTTDRAHYPMNGFQ
ncbi:chondroitin n-acetylgalactosaminyltransferase domain-containing protein [Phthorimaea operculella]|nr:chondroitin n-acetylgalactosaminyltransferase domain-containing protein [Phthorimaea operculella]